MDKMETEAEKIIAKISTPHQGRKNLCCNEPRNWLLEEKTPLLEGGIPVVREHIVRCSVCGYKQIILNNVYDVIPTNKK